MGLFGGYVAYRIGKNRGEKKAARRASAAESREKCIICDVMPASCTEHGEVVFCSNCCGCN